MMCLTEPETKCLPKDELLALAHSVSMFESISSEEIMALLDTTGVQRLSRGQNLIENGTAASCAYLVVEGEIEVLADTVDMPVLVGVRQRGDLVGEMALLTNSRRNATLRAKSDACLLEIEAESLHPWLRRNPEAILNILRTAVARMKSAETDMVQHQHLAGLGTLAAGLAHELNNPASALLRSAGQLAGAMDAWEAAIWELASESGHQTEAVQQLRASMDSPGAGQERPDALTLSDREQAIQTWLRQQGVPAAWEVTPVLVERGWTPDSLRDALDGIPADRIVPAVHWLAEGGRVHDLLHELKLSAQVIGDLVTAVKSYSRLDEAPVQLINLHDGIEQSLTILRYQLRGITIVRNYSETLPRIVAHATQLNQLWTNLIDNAAAAMGGAGTLTIATSIDDDDLVVSISDTGPGIPEDIRARLFEPFFTTKPPGQGTGLGLAISYSTVRKHGGTIDVCSEPGNTTFRVRLPLTGGSSV